jgi:hypothetical protein
VIVSKKTLSCPVKQRTSPPYAHWQRKEGKPPTMKYIAIIALAAFALSLGACASKSSTSSTTSTASTGYKK